MNPRTDLPIAGQSLQTERERVLAENRRRTRKVNTSLYAPWDAAQSFALAERKWIAAHLLHKLDRFPSSSARCLEVGVGRLGWLADLLSWGIPERNLSGIDLDEERVSAARAILPAADLQVADAAHLPYPSGAFELVVCSTAFSSILSEQVRVAAAEEIHRVLEPKRGALLWYDLAVDNPRNPNVKGISKDKVRKYFPGLDLRFRPITLAPPIARLVASRSSVLTAALASVPILRTHILAIGSR